MAKSGTKVLTAHIPLPLAEKVGLLAAIRHHAIPLCSALPSVRGLFCDDHSAFHVLFCNHAVGDRAMAGAWQIPSSKSKGLHFRHLWGEHRQASGRRFSGGLRLSI